MSTLICGHLDLHSVN